MALRFAPRSFARWADPDRAELGRVGELLAARAARRRGFRVLEHDLRTPFAQVDLVLLERGALVCAEVKTALVDDLDQHPSASFRPGRRCDRKRLGRQWRAARFVAAGRGNAERARVDLIEVWLERGSLAWRSEHHRQLRSPLSLEDGMPGFGWQRRSR